MSKSNISLMMLSMILLQGCGVKSPCPFTFNIDTICRVISAKNNEEFLVETYQVDEFGQDKLYIWKKGVSRVQIEHPIGKVKSYADNINQGNADQNQIKFDDGDSTMLIVNRIKFPISKIE